MKNFIFTLLTLTSISAFGEASQLPIQVRSSVSSSLPPNKETPVTMEVMIEQNCTDLKIAIRGIDGMTIKGGENKSYNECKQNTSVVREIKVKVPKDTLAYAIIDVKMTIAGTKFKQSLPIAFSSGKAIPKKKPLDKKKKN